MVEKITINGEKRERWRGKKGREKEVERMEGNKVEKIKGKRN